MNNPAHDARLILARVHRATYQDNSYAGEHKAAAAQLVAKLIELGAAQGLQSFQTENGRQGLSVGNFMAGATFFVDSEGAIQVRLEGHRTTTGVPRIAPLEYDPIAKTLVGTAVDTDIAPIPGERLPRVPALVVLAKLVEEIAAEAAR